jgi:hypothetical protein
VALKAENGRITGPSINLKYRGLLIDRQGSREDSEVVMVRTSAVIAIALFVLAGCGGEEDHPTIVTGKVLYRGAPLAGGTIVFEPDPSKGGDGPIAWGEIGREGRYILRTEAITGVTAGWHRITFAAAAGTILPTRYSDPALSGQTREVKAGRSNEIDFDLQ